VARPTVSLEEFFWQRVKKTETCWIWTGSIEKPFGYGTIHSHITGKRLGAHRASWMIHKGPIPENLFVCHKCDNPPCCNPNHLFLGTCADNNRDAWAKGRLLLPDQSVKLNRIYCLHGHPFNEQTIYKYAGKSGKFRPSRRCRECHRLAEERRRNKMKLGVQACT
jgi:hypothetical protein